MTEHAIYDYIPHRRTLTKLEGHAADPVKVADQLPTATPLPGSTRGSR
jgi:hypothetical protein